MFKNNLHLFYSFFLLIFLLLACNLDRSPLPIYGFPEISAEGDSIPYKIPDFILTNQDKEKVDNQDLSEFVYIADFFFTSCPSICPKVKKQMLRIYNKYDSNEQVKLVSHTIDPKRDTPERLKLYAKNLEVNTDKWIFLTGTKDSMLEMANAYFVSAMVAPEAPGGFDHSGKILLVDKDGHIRAFADGTEPKEVDIFLKKIKKLLAQYETK